MEYFLGFVFICLVLGAVGIVGIVYGKGKVASVDISEPVISIVESFKEKGRWKVDSKEQCTTSFHKSSIRFIVTDTKTGEIYNISCNNYIVLYPHQGLTSSTYKIVRFPKDINFYSLSSWMTKAEKDYVWQAVENISKSVEQRMLLISDRKKSKDEKQAKVNQDKERQRLVKLYTEV